MKKLQYASADENAQKAAVRAFYANKEMEYTYTAAQKNNAQQVIDVMSVAYNFDEVYTNYRKKFIAVKFTALRARDKLLAKQVQEILKDRHYSVVKTPQGTVVRIAQI